MSRNNKVSLRVDDLFCKIESVSVDDFTDEVMFGRYVNTLDIPSVLKIDLEESTYFRERIPAEICPDYVATREFIKVLFYPFVEGETLYDIARRGGLTRKMRIECAIQLLGDIPKYVDRFSHGRIRLKNIMYGHLIDSKDAPDQYFLIGYGGVMISNYTLIEGYDPSVPTGHADYSYSTDYIDVIRSLISNTFIEDEVWDAIMTPTKYAQKVADTEMRAETKRIIADMTRQIWMVYMDDSLCDTIETISHFDTWKSIVVGEAMKDDVQSTGDFTAKDISTLLVMASKMQHDEMIAYLRSII